MAIGVQCVLQLLLEVDMRPCDTVVKRPITSTDVMSPCYTQRKPSHILIYTEDYTFSYHSKKFICACSHYSAHAHVTNSEVENLNVLKLPLDAQGNGRFPTV